MSSFALLFFVFFEKNEQHTKKERERERERGEKTRPLFLPSFFFASSQYEYYSILSFFLFFFFRLRSLLFSLFLVPRRRVKCSTHCFHVVFFWIKALLLKKSHFFPVLVVQKKKVQTLKSRFCPQKRKRSGKNISPIHTLFFLSSSH